MQLRRFDDAAAFYAAVEPFLLACEAENNLMLGLTTTLMKSDPLREPPYLACVENGGEIAAAALRAMSQNLVISQVTDDAALGVLADDLQSVYGELFAVVSAKKVSKRFVDVWQSLTGQEHRLRRALRIYKLETVQPVKDVAGTMRVATMADRELLIEWLIAFSAEALEVMPREEAERAVDMRLGSDPALRGLRLWHDNGKTISMAGYSGPTPNGIRIGPVYTPLEYRKKGYASALVAALSQELLDSGRKFCFLYTDLSNPTANHIYQMIGYEPVSDVDEYRFIDRG